MFHLEWLFQEDEVAEIPIEVGAAIKRVDRRNICHEFVSVVLSRRSKWEHVTKNWLEQALVVRVEKLHQLWTERCKIVHECKTLRIRIEDRYILPIYIKRMFRCIDADSL